MASKLEKLHVVIFPFMSQGHTIPLLDLSKELSRRGLKVTIITTPSNSPAVKTHISDRCQSNDIVLKEISFPNDVPGLPKGCENTSQLLSVDHDHLLTFYNATRQLQQPFEQALSDMSFTNPSPACVISDSFLGWTADSCRACNIPRFVFNGMGGFASAVRKSLSIDQTHKNVSSESEPLKVKGFGGHDLRFDITRADLPSSLREMDLPVSQFYMESEKQDIGCHGVIVNSFVDLENDDVIASLEAIYGNKTRAWCVGPLFLYDHRPVGSNPDPVAPWADWLNQRMKKSVMYVSFGSQLNLSEAQLNELAYGLEMSRVDYMWVVRSRKWDPPGKLGRERGLIVREWVDQRWALGHEAVGGLLSHCGWNTVLEGLSSGLPILAWPMMAEQHLNAKYLVEEVQVGVRLLNGSSNSSSRGKRITVRREEICGGVRELMMMGGERREKVRERAVKMGEMAKRAVQPGGSSYKCLDELVEDMKQHVN